jgi:hypothetical protein
MYRKRSKLLDGSPKGSMKKRWSELKGSHAACGWGLEKQGTHVVGLGM